MVQSGRRRFWEKDLSLHFNSVERLHMSRPAARDADAEEQPVAIVAEPSSDQVHHVALNIGELGDFKSILPHPHTTRSMSRLRSSKGAFLNPSPSPGASFRRACSLRSGAIQS